MKQWLYEPGLPEEAVIPESASLQQAANLASQWADGNVSLETAPLENWSPLATVHFINNLPDILNNEQLRELDERFAFSASRNAEIGRSWFIQVAKRRFQPAYDAMKGFLKRHGRMRLVVPVYKELAENGHDEALADSIFAVAKPGYHPITIMAAQAVLTERAGD